MSNETVRSDGSIAIRENGEYVDKVYEAPVLLGEAFSTFIYVKRDCQHLKNWKASDVIINDMAYVVIEDSTITRLSVQGFCILKNCKIDHLHVAMFGNVFIVDGNEIHTLSIQGTVHTISDFSKVQRIELHSGGRIRLRTRDFQTGRPPQPKNLLLDMDRAWYCGILSITKHQDYDEAEYWAFG